MYDGDVLAKAEELGKPGLVTIKQKEVGVAATAVYVPCGRRVPGSAEPAFAVGCPALQQA
jgi:hypothetical protein